MRSTPWNRRQSSASGARAISEPLEGRRLLAAAAFIFISDAAGNLYEVNVSTGNSVSLGNMNTGSASGIDQIGSSASTNGAGNLYGTDGILYQINPATAAATAIGGGVGVTVTALTTTTGIIYGSNTALYTLSATTGAATLVGNLNLPDQVDPNTNNVYPDTISEDLSFDNGVLYLSAHIHDQTAGDEFFSVNTTTGAASLIGSIGFNNVTGLATVTSGTTTTLYGVTSAGQIISINPATGGGTFVSTINPATTAAITDAAALVQPPAPPSNPPAASFTATNFTTNLNSAAATLTVQLTGGTATGNLQVFYDTDDYAPGSTAVPGVDYVSESGFINFPVGVTTESLLIPILNSQSLGANKDFFVDLTDPYTDGGGSSNPPYVLISPDTAEVTIQNVNSAFEISPTTVSVNDTAGTASITVQRLGVSSDEETVDFATVYPSSANIGTEAQPGVNYDTVLTTLTFQPGVTSQTVQIPILDSTSNVGSSENVLLQLTNPQVIPPETGSPTAQNLFLLGSPNSSLVPGTGLLTITNVDTSAPAIQTITLNPNGKRIASISVQFSEPVTQASAEALTSYGLFLRNKDGPYATGPRTAVQLSLASYDASTDTVVLTPKKSLSENKIYQLVAYGSNGVTDALGHPVQGNGGTGSASANYSSFFGLGNHLRYVDADGDTVMLKLTGPGLLDLRRAFDGDASSLVLDDTTPDSVLTGSVKKGRYGDGLATIDLVGPTGGVNNELTKPPFIIVILEQ
jgi:hypothetical protein